MILPTIVLGFISLIFCPSLAFAQGFVFVEQHKGESSYVVKAGDLKSKLDFPFKLQAAGIGFDKVHQGIRYTFKASKVVKNLRTTGKDYDWKSNQLTVFSSSNSDVEDFFSVGLEVAKDVTNRSAVFANIQYRELDLVWSDTKQQDFVENKLSNLIGDTLRYKQNFYQLNLGVSYQYPLSNRVSFNIKPSVVFGYVKSVDEHLRRNFYTVQNSFIKGYGVSAILAKSIDKDSILSLLFSYENYQDKHSKMDYYPPFSSSYSLPASYKHNIQKISASYQQQF
ncbi:hypothetical protein BHECKSOX2_1475 [Bathymodiolus heckerae thiotrophic gill symbiont]|uniref:hypothetical protein n=1 Tax=Bathymodiolus heckerae thiotrophic gill symbiont TaxID=1052212 RepID=UPI0010B4B209|nr:hypothetical protein [Bathymodiolus heckerae thiotrophic gill symbiont]CAC9449701.1 hypothetical protein [uncultured Gammaproteobacteria bacterium]SMN12938.1 hypothetical protein BHECKSOX2_1475 [Bathymodiolus heckerae thiotrophic gill symbiont]